MRVCLLGLKIVLKFEFQICLFLHFLRFFIEKREWGGVEGSSSHARASRAPLKQTCNNCVGVVVVGGGMAVAAVVLALALLASPLGVAALPKFYAEGGKHGVSTTKVTVGRSGVGFFEATVYYPVAGGSGGKCTDVASCYMQSMATSGVKELAEGRFPLVAFGLNTFISGQEVYGSTMRHIASHGFVVCATNSRYIQPAAEAVEMVDCINHLEKENKRAGSRFRNKLDLAAGVGVLGYSQGGAASLDAAARLGDRCAGAITQHAQPSASVRDIKCPLFLHSGDGDSLTGIMRAMIWPGATTPKIFAVMRGAHHMTPVPPSPWDPWSLAWLLLYQKGDLEAGKYLWGGGEVEGSLRALRKPGGTMASVDFDPDAVWGVPYARFGVQSEGKGHGTREFTYDAPVMWDEKERERGREREAAAAADGGRISAPAMASPTPPGMWSGMGSLGTSGGGGGSPLGSIFGGNGASNPFASLFGGNGRQAGGGARALRPSSAAAAAPKTPPCLRRRCSAARPPSSLNPPLASPLASPRPLPPPPPPPSPPPSLTPPGGASHSATRSSTPPAPSRTCAPSHWLRGAVTAGPLRIRST